MASHEIEIARLKKRHGYESVELQPSYAGQRVQDNSVGSNTRPPQTGTVVRAYRWTKGQTGGIDVLVDWDGGDVLWVDVEDLHFWDESFRPDGEEKHPLVRLLEEAGWREAGGGENFVSYEEPHSYNQVFVFESTKIPDEAHWIFIPGGDEEKLSPAAGFSEPSLRKFLALRKVEYDLEGV